jgi:hypothetical protein
MILAPCTDHCGDWVHVDHWESNADNFTAVDISIPAAVTVFSDQIYRAPRNWTERSYHKLIYFHEVDEGWSRRGHDLILVARSRERLDALATRLTDDIGRSVKVIAADLNNNADLARVE